MTDHDIADVLTAWLRQSDPDDEHGMSEVVITDCIVVAKGTRLSNGATTLHTASSEPDEITARGLVSYLVDVESDLWGDHP